MLNLFPLWVNHFSLDLQEFSYKCMALPLSDCCLVNSSNFLHSLSVRDKTPRKEVHLWMLAILRVNLWGHSSVQGHNWISVPETFQASLQMVLQGKIKSSYEALVLGKGIIPQYSHASHWECSGAQRKTQYLWL